MKSLLKMFIALLICLALSACNAVQRRGMLGDRYVSTSQPSVSMGVRDMPLITGGEGRASLHRGGVLGGLSLNAWYALYGGGDGNSPLAVVAHAELPLPWLWDASMSPAFAVNEGAELVDGVGFTAWTRIVEPERDPFVRWTNPALLENPDAPARRWIARTFAARRGLDRSKILMEYREPLPADIESLPNAGGDFIAQFEERARRAFVVGAGAPEARPERGYAQGILWRYMDDAFWGTASRDESVKD